MSDDLDLFDLVRANANKVLTGIALTRLLWNQGVRARQWVRARTEYLVSVKATDAAYEDLHDWLVSQVPSRRRRSLTAVSERSGMAIAREPGAPPPPSPKISLIYDGVRQQKIVVGGHQVTVAVARDEPSANFRFRGDDYDSWATRWERLLFTCPTVEARDAVLALIQGFVDAKALGPLRPRFYAARPWGSWDRRDDLPLRPIESVILGAGQMERLSTDLQRFLASEHYYVERAMPWRRGYVFHGPPGTGKTSAARALASANGLDMHYMPLGDMRNDTDLLALVNGVDPRSCLLLEDIDVFHAARERTDETGHATLSGLLNAIDGVATPHGIVIMMTTNDLTALDDALLRAGRADVIERFGYADAEQIGRLFFHFFGCALSINLDHLPAEGLCPAEVIDVLVRNREDVEAARFGLLDLTTKALSQC